MEQKHSMGKAIEVIGRELIELATRCEITDSALYIEACLSGLVTLCEVEQGEVAAACLLNRLQQHAAEHGLGAWRSTDGMTIN